MKNFKSIIYICLAAVLVLGVTACQDAAAYKQVVGLTATTTKAEYIVGEYVDPSTISAVVEFSDGSMKTISGSQVSVSVAKSYASTCTGNKFIAEGTVDVTVAYGGVSNTVEVKAANVANVVLGNLPTTAGWDGENATIDTSAVTATVKLTTGSERELAAGEFTDITYTIAEEAANKKDAVVTVTGITIFGEEYMVTPSSGETAVTFTGTPEWKVNIGDEAVAFSFDSTYALKFKYVYTSTTSGFSYKNEGTETYYAGDKVTWTAYLENTAEDEHKGATYELKDSELYFEDTAAAPNREITLNANSAKTYTAMYTGDTSVTEDLVIVNGEDWIENVEPKFDGETASAGTITYNDFKYTVTTYLDEDDETTLSNMLDASTNVRVVNNTVDAEDTTYIPRLIITYGKGEGTPHPVTLSSVSVAE